MTKGMQAMRQAILASLYRHLQENYTGAFPPESFTKKTLSVRDVDALLAFKSEPYLIELRNAIERLDKGTYGVCVYCKERINHRALILDPARRVCPECEKQLAHSHMIDFEPEGIP